MIILRQQEFLGVVDRLLADHHEGKVQEEVDHAAGGVTLTQVTGHVETGQRSNETYQTVVADAACVCYADSY